MTETDRNFVYVICGFFFFVVIMITVTGIIAIKCSEKERQHKQEILNNTSGRIIEYSELSDYNTVRIHFKNGGGLSIRGHKGLTIE